MDATPVTHDEALYRRIPEGGDYFVRLPNGTVRFSSQAFATRTFRPSVDRAQLCDSNPAYTQTQPSDGVTSLIASMVRSIQSIVQQDDKQRIIQTFGVDIEHVPIVNQPPEPDNPAHAEIYMLPACPNKTVFRKLCEQLALIATQRQWEIPPESLR